MLTYNSGYNVMPACLDEVVNRQGTNSVKWSKAAGEGLFPMHLADMEFLTDFKIVSAISERSKHAVYGYTHYPETLFDSAGNWFGRRHNWGLKKEWISVCHGVISSLNTAVRAFSKAGGKIIIQPPVYNQFYSAIENNGRIVRENRLVYKNNRYEINFEEFAELAKDAEIFMLCNPHNPVGRVWTKEELTLLGDICLKNNVRVISDDIHCDFTYGAGYTPLASLKSSYENICLTCLSPSKTFNLAGLNASIAVIPCKLMREKFDAEMTKNGLGRVNIFGMAALEAAYSGGDAWLDNVLEYLKGSLTLATEILSGLKNGRLVVPEGTYLLWVDLGKANLDESVMVDILRHKVGIISEPGSSFGAQGNGFIRLNMACSRGLLEKYLTRLVDAFNRV